MSLYEPIGHQIHGGGGVIQTPRKIFPSKNMETENSMINLNEKKKKKTEKVTLVNPFRSPPPNKNLSYTALFSRNMTLKHQGHEINVFCISMGYLAEPKHRS